MKIAILSDIHGNTIALDAVLADIEANGGVDAFWVIGDLTSLGYDPVGVVKRVQQLKNLSCTIGNADYYAVSGKYPSPFLADVQADMSQLALYGEVQRSFAWTAGALAAHGLFEWLQNLPVEVRFTLSDGTRALGVHAEPSKFEGRGFRMDYSDDEMSARLSNVSADLVFVGHVHWPMNRIINGVHLVVTGGISNQFSYDLRAKYVVLTASEDGYAVTHHYVDYDYVAAVEALKNSHHASVEFLLQFARGEYESSIQKKMTTEQIHPHIPVAGHKYRGMSR